MRGALVVAVTAAALSVLAPAADAASRCAHKHSKTVAANRVVRVFSIPNHSQSGRRFYACLRSSGYRHRLGASGTDYVGPGGSVGPVRLRYAYVAWATWDGDRYGNSEAHVYSFDMRKRRRVHDWAGSGLSDVCELPSHTVMDLVVTPRGSIAFTDHGYSSEPGCSRKAVRAIGTGDPVTLDGSNAIRLRSLTWSRGRVRWRHGDATRSAPLR